MQALVRNCLLVGAMMAASVGWAQAATLTRTTAYEYDPATGLVVKEIVEPDNAQLRVDTVYTRDGYGNKLTATVSSPATGTAAIATRVSAMTYDAQGRFPATVTNALNQSETRVYDSRFGGMTNLTGPNNLTTQWQYDGFGRQILEIRADGNRTQTLYPYCGWIPGGTWDYYCPDLGAYNILAIPLASDGVSQNGARVTSYRDRLNREVQKDVDAPTQDNEVWAVVQNSHDFDTLGRVVNEARWTRHGSEVFPTYYSSNFEYDILNRVTKLIAPDNSVTTTAYSGLVTTVTNPLLQTHSETRNSRGEIVGTRDNLNGVTSYAYDPFGNLVQTTDPAGNVSSMQYDLRGRKIAMTDPDMGHWTYGYDVLGQLVSQTDAKLQTTTFAYDLLGRMTARVEPDLTSSWAYDSTTMGIGKLATASASNGYSRTHSYDSLGRPSSTSLTVDGNTHTISQTYNTDGRVDTLTYPSGFAVKYLYVWTGQLDEVRNNATGATIWKAERRDYEFNVTQWHVGNGLVSIRTYDPPTGRTAAIQAGPGSAVQNDSYTWDTAGNLLTRSDATQGLTETFTYDGLNQVATAAVTGGPSKSFSYDAIGNITSKSDAGTYSYPATGSARPHAVASIAGTVNAAYSYDDNGNLISGAGRSVSWTSFNMPATIQRGTSVLGYDYDTEHNRIRQADTSTTTLFFNDPASGLTVEKVVGAGGAVTWNNYVYVNGAIVVAFYEQPAGTSQWRYFHQDQLGSIEVITDETGTVVERQGYDTWGKRRYPGGADDPSEAITSLTDRSYTGHAYLQEVGLIHMNGRVYDPVLGRFMSADPNVQSPTHTQSFNRYAYVMNNPLNATDPTGFVGNGPEGSFGLSFGPVDSYLWGQPYIYFGPLSQTYQSTFISNPATTPYAKAINNIYLSGGSLSEAIESGKSDNLSGYYGFSSRAQYNNTYQLRAPSPNLFTLSIEGKMFVAMFDGYVADIASLFRADGLPVSPITGHLMNKANGRDYYADYVIAGATLELGEMVSVARPAIANVNRTTELRGLAAQAVDLAVQFGLTPRQEAALLRNPNLEAAFWGERYDFYFRRLFGEDPVSGITATLRGKVGPDVFDPITKEWWDLTTPRQWQSHVDKYAPSFGEGTPLFTAPR